MMQGKMFIVVLVALVIGFGTGFAFRPVIAPIQPTTIAVRPISSAAPVTQARGTPYFAAHLDEARRVLSGCRDGSLRGDECAYAERAVTEAEGRDRFKKFMGH